MTAIESNPLPDAQSSGQWAVRWFAVVFVAALSASVPLIHLIWHGALGNEEPVLTTRSQTRAPDATIGNVMSGEWMLDKDRELQELSPVVWSLRGHWNELRYRCGIPQSARVAFGKDEWLFLKRTLNPSYKRFDQARDKRLAVFGEVRDLVRAAGAELVVVVVPDKARLYQDRAYADGVMPKSKAEHYAVIMAELDSLGIARVDLATPMAAMRATITSGKLEDELFFARDTHWRPGGALVAGAAIRNVVEAKFGSRLSPRQTLRLTGPSSVRAVGDLTMQLGFLAAVRPEADGGQHTMAMSLLTDDLAEVRQYFGAEVVTEVGPVGMFGKDPDAEILILGSSFSKENGKIAISIALSRSVRAEVELGAGASVPMLAALDEFRSGTKAKVVIWEMVERGLSEGFWLDPKL